MLFYLRFVLLGLFIYQVYSEIRDPIPKQLHECNVEEIALLKDIFNELRREGFLDYYARVHVRHFSQAHNDPMHFFPFHGHMVRHLEERMRVKDARIQELPVWNITETPVVPAYFTYLTSDWGEIRRRQVNNVPIPANIVSNLYRLNYRTNLFNFVAQCTPAHDMTHNWYGGTFGSPWSPLDPMFWFFHKYFDTLYVNWALVNNQPIQTHSHII